MPDPFLPCADGEAILVLLKRFLCDVLAVVACDPSQCPPGPVGPAGPTGPAGEPGPAGAGVPSGESTWIQFNYNGSFFSTNDLSFDPVARRLVVGGSVEVTEQLNVGSVSVSGELRLGTGAASQVGSLIGYFPVVGDSRGGPSGVVPVYDFAS